MNYENVDFIINPHFKFKEIISDKIEGYSVSSLFDIFKDKEGDTILAFPFFDIKNPRSKDFHISLMTLKDNKEKIKLEGHIARLNLIKYFYDVNTNNKYLISSDKKNKLIIWDINDNYKILLEDIIEDEQNIKDILMLFINKQIYLVIASSNEYKGTKIINLNPENNYQINSIIELNESSGFSKFSLSHWYYKKENLNYIIQTGKNKIIINEFESKEIYSVIDTSDEYSYNNSSLVYSKNDEDFLLICSSFGLLIFYNLINKNIIKTIRIKKAHLINLVKWNQNIFITINTNKKVIYLIDSNENSLINSMEIKEIFGHERFLRKVKHPLYGECLLSVGNDYKIKLYIDKIHN